MSILLYWQDFPNIHMNIFLRKRCTATVSVLCISLMSVGVILSAFTDTAHAASSWSPTLLVNTEAFQTIDVGDGSSNIELRFGESSNRRLFYDVTAGKFTFTQPVTIQGNLTATGSLSVKNAISGATLRIDGGGDIWGTLGVSGATVLKSTLNVTGNTTATNVKARGSLSGTTLRIDGNADVWGSVSATGAIKTRADLTINSDADTNDATLTFGNNTANQTVKFSNARQRFQFSKDLSVTGTLSGSSLTIDNRTTTFGTTSYTWPNAQGSAGTFLKNDGAGGLSWTATSVGPSSGSILSLHPEYQNAVYVQSGSTAVGTLKYSASGALDNYYRWSTTKGTLQDYWINVRVQVPKNFAHFETASGIQLRLRTSTTNSADNQITVRVVDTAGTTVAVGNNANLVSTIANQWRTNTITGVTGGTFTPLGYITLLIKVAATSTGFTDLGFINLNWSNTTP